MDPISSTQNAKVKQVVALQSRARVRRKQGKIVLDGVRLIEDAWVNGSIPEYVFYTEGDQSDDASALITKLIRGDVLVLPVTDEVMQHMSDTPSPQGMMGVFLQPKYSLASTFERILILDAIRDPGNMGTMIRTAAGAGVDAVVLAPGCVDAYNPKVLRGGMGAHFRVPVLEMDWDEIASHVSRYRVYLADGYAETDYVTVDWTEKWALIVGSEADGASHDARALVEIPIIIPMAHATESLNAAVAAAVILFEAARQRRVSDS